MASAILFCLLCLLWLWLLPTDSDDLRNVSINIFSSIVFSTLLMRLAETALSAIGRWLEDPLKLTTDYDQLVADYHTLQDQLITWSNCAPEKTARFAMRRTACHQTDGSHTFPVVLLWLNDSRHRIEVLDSNYTYALPGLLEANFATLMRSHQYSVTYDSLMIRLNDLEVSTDRVTLVTGRTTYFASLASNRSMDYEFADSLSIRRLFQFGLGSARLAHSQLSNHLGFNCIIETSDNGIVFVQRSSAVSVAKGVLGLGIEASLKTRFALSEDGSFSAQGIADAVRGEMSDELNLKEDTYDAIALEDNLLSVYQDLVEGGKPQLLFHIKLKIDRAQLRQCFLAKAAVKRKGIDRVAQDGRQILVIDQQALRAAYIAPDGLTVQFDDGSRSGMKHFVMVPSSVASLVMFLKYRSVDSLAQ